MKATHGMLVTSEYKVLSSGSIKSGAIYGAYGYDETLIGASSQSDGISSTEARLLPIGVVGFGMCGSEDGYGDTAMPIPSNLLLVSCRVEQQMSWSSTIGGFYISWYLYNTSNSDISFSSVNVYLHAKVLWHFDVYQLADN